VPICGVDMDLQDINLRMVESCPEEITLQNSRSRIIETSFTLVSIIFWANFSVNYRVTINKFCNLRRQLLYTVRISRSSYINRVKRTSSSTSVITQFAGLVFSNLQNIPYPVGMLYVHRASGSMDKKLVEPWSRSISVPLNRINQASRNRYTSNQKLLVFEYWFLMSNYDICFLLTLKYTDLCSGGIRGLIQLEVLRLLEKEFNSRIPVRFFFDLVIGNGWAYIPGKIYDCD